MIFSLSTEQLKLYVRKQISIFFPDNLLNNSDFDLGFKLALERLEFCFRHIKRPYFYDGKDFLFNHLNGDHYAMLLYLLSHCIWLETSNEGLAAKVFLLNKYLHGIDAFYKVKLPDIFLFVHPLGTVLGNAQYGDYFVVYQNCTIGSKLDGKYPTFGSGVMLYSKSSIIGDCTIGDNVIFGAGSAIVSKNIECNRVVLGSTPSELVKPSRYNVAKDIFGADK